MFDRKIVVHNIVKYVTHNGISHLWLSMESKINTKRLVHIFSSLDATNEEVHRLSTVLGQSLESLSQNDYRPPLIDEITKEKFTI